MNAPASINENLLQIAYCDGPSNVTAVTPRYVTFEVFAEQLSKPSIGPKDGSYYLRGGDLTEPRRGNDYLVSADLVILDGDSRFDPETGEVAAGAPPMEAATDVLDAMGLNYVAHSSHSYVPGQLEKWRIVIPAKIANTDQMEQAYSYVLERLHVAGVYLAQNSESTTWAQLPQAFLTILYCATDCLSRCGASVKNLAHSASFHAGEKIAPSKPGIKHPRVRTH